MFLPIVGIVIVVSGVLGIAAEIFFEATGFYRCPVCGEWVRLGVNATNCEQPDDNWILCHGENASHKHTRGYHGIFGKSLE